MNEILMTFAQNAVKIVMTIGYISLVIFLLIEFNKFMSEKNEDEGRNQ
jgi:hypothetical protein